MWAVGICGLMVDLVLRVLGCGFVRGLVVFLSLLGAWFVGFLVDWRVLFGLGFLFCVACLV